MIVVATRELDVSGVRARLTSLGAGEMRTVAPSGARRLVLAAVDDEWQEERVAATLRAEGIVAVTRPDGGPRLEGWVRHTQPTTFGQQLSVCFAWSEHDRACLPGLIELGTGGFGSGQHPATRLMVDQLQSRITGGERVMDVGCGSGLLGLCALRLGASRVVAVDIQADAVDATRRNAALNQMDDRVEATLDPIDTIDGHFDAILANIGRSAIVELAPLLVERVAPDGWLAVSGLSPPQCSLVADFLRPLVEIERTNQGDWAGLVVGHLS